MINVLSSGGGSLKYLYVVDLGTEMTGRYFSRRLRLAMSESRESAAMGLSQATKLGSDTLRRLHGRPKPD